MTIELPDDLRLYGIRHHGPGSARSLLAALEQWQPDCILIEGPPDANDVLHWLAHADTEPPVSLLVYQPDQPKKARYYPFSLFSPEYQAIKFAAEADLTVRFMDLPQRHQLASDDPPIIPDMSGIERMTQAAGRRDYEAWWSDLMEERSADPSAFIGILEMMTAIREDSAENPSSNEPEAVAKAVIADRRNAQREAFMRHAIRQARREGHARIACVVGAFHAPALLDCSDEAGDLALTQDLPKVDVACTWVPWTYSRMSYFSGYGAGIKSPGWYQHLWEMSGRGATPTQSSIEWLTKVARLLRDEGLDASSAHIIEGVRLAEATAALRDKPAASLQELSEAAQTVLCFGNAEPMQLIQRELIVGEKMGTVSADTPMVPLQRDLYQQQKRLKLRPTPKLSTLKLDMRTERHLQRSHLLHRLNILNIPWGRLLPNRGIDGTYREVWKIVWKPDFAIKIVEASVWGNTVLDATIAYANDRAENATDLESLTKLLDKIILAELPETISKLMQLIQDRVAVSSDIPHMMAALPPLARVLRYGNVRQTEKSVVQEVVDGLLTRICIGLPSTAASLDHDAAADIFDHINAVTGVAQTLTNREQVNRWYETLRTLADMPEMHGLVGGRCCRILLDQRRMTSEESAEKMAGVLSVRTLAGMTPEQIGRAAFWLEGFLKGSGLVVVHDETLWSMLDEWVQTLQPEHFLDVVPFLRRTFASYSEAVRQQMFERVRDGVQKQSAAPAPAAFDAEQAALVLPYLAQILGVDHE